MQCCTEKVTTVESQFFKPPKKTKIGSKNQRVREIRGKIEVFDCGGKQVLVRVFSRFETIQGFDKSEFHCTS